MLNKLSYFEKEVLLMIIQGHNYSGIKSWIGINYKEYKIIKKSLLKKLGVKKITQLLTAALHQGLTPDEI